MSDWELSGWALNIVLVAAVVAAFLGGWAFSRWQSKSTLPENAAVADDSSRSTLPNWPLWAWFTAAVGLVVVLFPGLAVLYGGGSWPTAEDEPEWMRQTMLATVPVAGILAGSVAIGMTIRRQKSTERTVELAVENAQFALEQAERDVIRGLRERFTVVAEQLGNDAAPVRLAGVYALAALADDWHNRGERAEDQTCINLLCSYIRAPRKEPIDPLPTTAKLTENPKQTPSQEAETQVRTTITTVIADHLKPSSRGGPAWSGYKFDFSGAKFDAGFHEFALIQLESGTVLNFSDAIFTGGYLSFYASVLKGGAISFDRSRIEGGFVSFTHAYLRGVRVSFAQVKCHWGGIVLEDARLLDGVVDFTKAELSGGYHDFRFKEVTSGTCLFTHIEVGNASIHWPWVGNVSPIPERWPVIQEQE